MARAARRAGVRHRDLVTLEDTRRFVPLAKAERMPTLLGRYKVPHLDAKGESDRFFREAGCADHVPPHLVLLGELHRLRHGPEARPDGAYAIGMPMGNAKLPGIAAEDIGRCAFGIFKAGHTMAGRTVGVAGEHLTGVQMAAALSTALGHPMRYDDVPPEAYRSLGFPGAADLGNMFQFKRDFEAQYCGARNVAAARALNPRLQDFAAWLAANGERIRLA